KAVGDLRQVGLDRENVGSEEQRTPYRHGPRMQNERDWQRRAALPSTHRPAAGRDAAPVATPGRADGQHRYRSGEEGPPQPQQPNHRGVDSRQWSVTRHRWPRPTRRPPFLPPPQGGYPHVAPSPGHVFQLPATFRTPTTISRGGVRSTVSAARGPGENNRFHRRDRAANNRRTPTA